MIVTFTRAI